MNDTAKIRILYLIYILRILSGIAILLFLIKSNFIISGILMIFAILSDGLDGLIYRSISNSKKIYTVLDPIADFIVVLYSLVGLIFMGVYSVKSLIIILFMFLQFWFIREKDGSLYYDPLGKYYGLFCFIFCLVGICLGGLTIPLVLIPIVMEYLLLAYSLVIIFNRFFANNKSFLRYGEV